MKKYLFGLLALSVFGLGSCGLISKLIPDIDTVLKKTLMVDINSSSGQTDGELVDVTSSDDYDDFKDRIGGYEVDKITYLVSNMNVPADMYLSGQIVASLEDGSSPVVIGTINNANLQDLLSAGDEVDITQVASGVDQVIDWLDSPGTFLISANFELKTSSGAAYGVTGSEGYGFDMEVKFYVTVITEV